MHLWKYSKVTGYWYIARDVTPDTAQQWLDLYRKDEPNEFFTVSQRRPTINPTRGTRKRKANPRRKAKKDVCARKAARKFVVCAQRKGGAVLKFVGGGRGKFAQRGRPMSFTSKGSACVAMRVLRDSFRQELKHYRLFIQ